MQVTEESNLKGRFIFCNPVVSCDCTNRTKLLKNTTLHFCPPWRQNLLSFILTSLLRDRLQFGTSGDGFHDLLKIHQIEGT